MKKITSFIVCVLILISAIYLFLPTPGFVQDPPKSLQSIEPADTESIYRRSFYTSMSRQEIMNYYAEVFSPNLSLNHPPEFGTTFIRDQTRSSWLEELIHMGKDSLYVNGFYPTKATEQININGINYKAKITVRYVPSSIISRLSALGLVSVSVILLLKEYGLA